MPKLIDYPRTSYTGAWELAEIIDDTGGKCAIETAARKLNRKVSGSFKAIIGSAVKFGLMTSKRELLTTTTLFRRIKHAYDKAEELQFHREAFLTPPLFTQLCRKFRNRELPVQMLDVMLIREFGVEEINAQNVAKAFVDGCRMCGLLNERNIIADIDAFSTNRAPRRELASPTPSVQTFSPKPTSTSSTNSSEPQSAESREESGTASSAIDLFGKPSESFVQNGPFRSEQLLPRPDAVASLFGLGETPTEPQERQPVSNQQAYEASPVANESFVSMPNTMATNSVQLQSPATGHGYQMQMSGPGVNTLLDISDEDDVAIAIALLEKIRRQFRANS